MMKNKPAILFAYLISTALVAACGQKGPLFLPGSPSTISTPVPAQQPAPVEATEEEDDEQETNDPG
jgi:predicted small lipoprotein YifL